MSELFWLWGCFYTSSLIATLAIGLQIPMTIVADIVWRKRSYEAVFMIGVIPMFFSFFVITMLTHYDDWDPCLDFLISAKRLFCSGWQKFVLFFFAVVAGDNEQILMFLTGKNVNYSSRRKTVLVKTMFKLRLIVIIMI